MLARAVLEWLTDSLSLLLNEKGSPLIYFIYILSSVNAGYVYL